MTFTIDVPKPLPIGGTAKRSTLTVDGVEVRLTNLDKIFWPDDGLTKGDLLAYYFNVADVILPHVRARPLTLKRMPDGITGGSFFQKDAPDYTPEWVTLCAIEPEDGNIDETVVIEKTADLLFVANLGCIELHPLHGRCERYDQPDYLVLDLDPMPQASFAEALVIAQQVRVVLDFLGLDGYPKTSGITGLQIYVPVADKHTYAETRSLAERVGGAIVKAAPDLATMEWNVGTREGRVFIDHKMNRRAASLASAYSVRPEPAAPVSAPVTWDEVDEGSIRPQDFTMATILERLGKVGDLFEAVTTNRQDLDDALDKLGVERSREDISEGRVRRRVRAGERNA